MDTVDQDLQVEQADGLGERAAAGPSPAGESVAVVGAQRQRRVARRAGGRVAADGGARDRAGAAAPDGDPEPAAGGGTGDRHRQGPPMVRRSRFVVAVIAAVACALAAVGFGLAWSNLNGRQQAADQVQAVSRAFVLDLTNLTPGTVDTRINDLLAASTGTFARQATSFFNSGNPPVRQQLVTAKAEEQGQIRSLAVESVNGSTASTFAVVDLSYRNDKITQLQSDVLRLELSLVDTAKGWKVAEVTVLNGSTGGVLAPPTGAPGSAGATAGTGPSGSAGAAPATGSSGSAGSS